MTKLERQHKTEYTKLEKLRNRQAELQAKAEEATTALAWAKETFGAKLAKGRDTVDALSDQLTTVLIKAGAARRSIGRR